jgi:2-desacetyl-2-hydroxyethyl bacteriochlorophyllide A dehydrogenase
MKAAVFYNAHDAKVEERPEPKAQEGYILVEVNVCGVCGTDKHIYEGSYPARFPVVPGHEFSGVVVEVGRGVSQFQKGDRVTIDPNIPCGTCHFCRSGRPHFCVNNLTIGQHVDGAYAPLVSLPAKQAYLLPDRMSLDQGAMTEPVACAVHGIDRAQIKPGETVVVLGAGPIGLILMQLAKAAGAGKIIVSEPRESRRRLALELGADWAVDPRSEPLKQIVQRETEYGADLVIEAAGVAETVQQAFDLIQPTGKILVFGACDPKDEIRLFPYNIYRYEWSIIGSFVLPYTMERAMELIASGRVKVEPLFSHRLPIEKVHEAMDLMGTPEPIKILMDPKI